MITKNMFKGFKEIFNKIKFNVDDSDIEKDRNKYLGGSDIYKMSDTKMSVYSVFDYKLKSQKNIETEHTELGHELEEKVRDLINKKFNLNIKPASLKLEELGIRANIDGLDEKTQTLIEFKSNTSKTGSTLFKKYLKQIHFYMLAYGIKKAILVEIPKEKGQDGKYKTDYTFEELKITKITKPIPEIENEVLQNINDYIDLTKFNKFNYNENNVNVNQYLGNSEQEIEKLNNDEKVKKLYESMLIEKEFDNKIKLVRKEIEKRDFVDNNYLKITRTKPKLKFDNSLWSYENRQDYLKVYEKALQETNTSYSLYINNRNSKVDYDNDLDQLDVIDDDGNVVESTLKNPYEDKPTTKLYEIYRQLILDRQVYYDENKENKETLKTMLAAKFVNGVVLNCFKLIPMTRNMTLTQKFLKENNYINDDVISKYSKEDEGTVRITVNR